MATRSAKIDQKADLIWAIADKLRMDRFFKRRPAEGIRCD